MTEKNQAKSVGDWLAHFNVSSLSDIKFEDPKFVVDDDAITLLWGGSDYIIHWSQISTKNEVLQWIHHIGGKKWEDMTPERIKQFIEAVYDKWGWDIYEYTDA